MAQPGWYPDPNGYGQRWWDGTNWTQHVQPMRPAGLPIAVQPAVPDPSARGPVLNTTVEKKHVYADPQVISYNGVSIPLADIEWVRYWVVRTATRGPFGIGRSSIGAEWHFEVGRFPVEGGPMVAMAFGTTGNREQREWQFLVELSRQYLEPRLIAEMVARVRNGEAIDVGAGLKVYQGGVDAGRIALPWHAISGTSLSDGRIWIHQTGSARPVLSIPQQNPNAVLIPALLAAVKA